MQSYSSQLCYFILDEIFAWVLKWTMHLQPQQRTTISIGQRNHMTFYAYIFGAKYFNSKNQLPNNLHLKYVSLKYQFYKQIKKETKKFIQNTSKIMANFFPYIFFMCFVLSLSTIASLGMGIINTLEKFVISYCPKKLHL